MIHTPADLPTVDRFSCLHKHSHGLQTSNKKHGTEDDWHDKHSAAQEAYCALLDLTRRAAVAVVHLTCSVPPTEDSSACWTQAGGEPADRSGNGRRARWLARQPSS